MTDICENCGYDDYDCCCGLPGLSDEVLDEIGEACESAYYEGAFDGQGEAARMLRAEFKRRARPWPQAYGRTGPSALNEAEPRGTATT